MRELVFGLFAIATAVSTGSAGEPNWQRDYAVARRQAETTGKLLFISIHTTWCGPCQMMHRTTFHDPQVVARLERGCVCLSLDGDADRGLVAQLSVDRFPTEMFASPDGRILEVIVGYADTSRFLKSLDRAEKLAGAARTAQAAPKQQVSPRPTQEPTRTAIASSNPPVSSGDGQLRRQQPVSSREATVASRESVDSGIRSQANDGGPSRMVLASKEAALGGFCPVTMIERAELVRGDAKFQSGFEDRRFFFRSAREKALFDAAPLRYLPAEAGRCVVTWKENRRWQSGTIEYPAMFADQLYLFPNSDLRNKFLQDPERYVDRAGHAYR